MHSLCVGNSTQRDGWMDGATIALADTLLSNGGRTEWDQGEEDGRGMSTRVSAVHIVTRRDFALYPRSTTSDNNLM